LGVVLINMSKQYQKQKSKWKEQGRQEAFKEVGEVIDKHIKDAMDIEGETHLKHLKKELGIK